MRCCELRTKNQFEAYIFDVDGTLVDSAADICGAIQQVLISAGRPDVEDQFLRGFIGRHLDELWPEVLPGCSAEQMADLLVQYRALYLARKHANTRVFPGVRETLSQLRGKKSTATTKSTQTTRSVLESFDLLRFFDHVQGTDGFPAKPNPDILFKAAEGLGAAVGNCLFVGDSPADMEAAKRAGMPVCAVTYGYGLVENLADWKPDFVIGSLQNLLK